MYKSFMIKNIIKAQINEIRKELGRSMCAPDTYRHVHTQHTYTHMHAHTNTLEALDYKRYHCIYYIRTLSYI